MRMKEEREKEVIILPHLVSNICTSIWIWRKFYIAEASVVYCKKKALVFTVLKSRKAFYFTASTRKAYYFTVSTRKAYYFTVSTRKAFYFTASTRKAFYSTFSTIGSYIINVCEKGTSTLHVLRCTDHYCWCDLNYTYFESKYCDAQWTCNSNSTASIRICTVY